MSLFDALTRALPAAEVRPSQFHGEPALWVDGREFLHLHGDDTVEIRLTRRVIAALDEPRAPARALTSDWVIVSAHERELVLRLAVEAFEANESSGEAPSEPK